MMEQRWKMNDVYTPVFLGILLLINFTSCRGHDTKMFWDRNTICNSICI